MVVDAIRTYLDAASGLTELTRKRAVAAAKTLLRESGTPREGNTRGTGPREEDTAEPPEDTGNGALGRIGPSIQALASDLVATNQANRAAISDLVAAEVKRALDRLDMVSREDHDRALRRVAELERRVAALAAAQRAIRVDDRRGTGPVSTEDGVAEPGDAESRSPARVTALGATDTPAPATPEPAAATDIADSATEIADIADSVAGAGKNTTPDDAPAAGDGDADQDDTNDTATSAGKSTTSRTNKAKPKSTASGGRTRTTRGGKRGGTKAGGGKP